MVARQLRWSVQQRFCFALAASLVAVTLLPPAGAFAYSCDSHCYGINHWGPNTAYVGDDTTMSIVSLGTPNNRLNNETWLIQHTGTGDCLTQFTNCWFEGGYTYTTQNAYEYYFTAWMSPETPYQENAGPEILASEYGQTVSVEIRQISSSGGYYVTIIPPVQSSYTNQDTASTMVPDQIDIGMELVGTSGGSASTADFTNNKYITVSSGVYGSRYFTTNGTTSETLPAAGGWNVTPASSSTGGDFQTSCVC
jgi:hypothetical protein